MLDSVFNVRDMFYAQLLRLYDCEDIIGLWTENRITRTALETYQKSSFNVAND